MRRVTTYTLLSILWLSFYNNSIVQGYGAYSSLSQHVISQSKISLQLKATLSRPKGEFLTIVLSPDARVLAAAVTGNGKTELWDTETGRLIASLDGRIFRPFSYPDFKLIDAFSPDGHTLVTIGGKEAKLWDTATGRLKHILQGHEKEIRSTAFSLNSKSLATGSADGTVKLWDIETGKQYAALSAFRVKKYPRWRIVSRSFAELFADVDVYFSPDSKRVLTVPREQETKLWDSATGRLEAVLGQKNNHAKFSPSGRFVLTHRSDFTGTDLWETERGQLKATFTFPSLEAEFSPNENWLGLVQYQGKKGLLNLKKMEIEIPLDFDSWFISRELFSPDNRIFVIASGLYHHQATLLDTSTGEVIATVPVVSKKGFDLISDYLKYVEQLSFHPSSQILMGANHKLVRFWDTKTGEPIKEITQGRDPATLSSDGKLLVTASKDKKSILLWEVKI